MVWPTQKLVNFGSVLVKKQRFLVRFFARSFYYHVELKLIKIIIIFDNRLWNYHLTSRSKYMKHEDTKLTKTNLQSYLQQSAIVTKQYNLVLAKGQ